jgi:Icc protein
VAIRVVQISDPHLFADPASRHKGIPTRETLREVIQMVRDRYARFERVVFTGDLAHDEQRETYEALRDMIGDWLPRCRLIPGNHDHRAFLRQAFPEIVPGRRGPISFAENVGDWRLIGLDTHVPGEVRGRIADEQLDWLESVLAGNRRPTVIFMHHPPISVESDWLDRLGLDDAESFEQLIVASPDVKLICTGHVHHDFHGRLGHAHVYTAPSTGAQFDPLAGDDESHYAFEPPGFRVITLERDRFQTEIVRLPELKYPPQDEPE